ncbi:MAG: hypothetical protein EBS38_08530, partial [Actinobacteria bacterium]|nr:hypothetical protein [Actinomycetota bacterium]
LLGTELSIALALTLGITTIATFNQPKGADTFMNAVLGTDFQAKVQEGDIIGGYEVNSGFGLREAPKTNQGYGSSDHKGVDLLTPPGTKLYMIGAGGTVECEMQPDGAGLYATIKPKDIPYTFQAMHLNNCQSGEWATGQVFAETGGEADHPNAGNSSGAHLHWGQLKDGQHVHPQKGYLTAAIVGNWSDLMNEAATAKKGFGDVTDRLMNTILIQESGGDPTAENVHTGAAGKYQILPENIPAWAEECGVEGATDVPSFLANPDMQDAIAACKLKQYWDNAKERGVDDHTACRMVASAWYSGNPDWYDSTAPQAGYPSMVLGFASSLVR